MQNRFVFFLNDISGGVANVVNNLLKFVANENFNFRVVLTFKPELGNESSRVTSFSTSHLVERFVYRRNENYYAVCKRLSKLIDPGDVLIANDWLELGMVSNLGLQNKVIYILHGDYDYYYELAEKHQSAIDAFICVSKHIEDKLKSTLPNRISDICYLPHVIPNVNEKIEYNFTRPLNIIFIGRLTPEKGYYILPDINNLLLKNNILVMWYIAGACADKQIELKRWEGTTNVHFMGNIPNDVLLNTINQYDLFILPSHAEGFPITLVETMKAGLVPLVSNLPSGMPELIENGITGYSFSKDDIKGYTNTILILNKDRRLLNTIGQNASEKANNGFNPLINAKAYENTFLKIQEMYTGAQKKANKVYGSRLDQKLIPNSITKLIRYFLHRNNLKQ